MYLLGFGKYGVICKIEVKREGLGFVLKKKVWKVLI